MAAALLTSHKNNFYLRRLAIITTHPVQYNAPLFRLLAERGVVATKVFYTWGIEGAGKKYDPGFGKTIQWDLPLLDGYAYTFVHNKAKSKGSHHFLGIHNPGLKKELSDWQPDAVLVFGWAFRSHLSLLRWAAKRYPVLFRGDSTLLDDQPQGIKRWLRNAVLKQVYKNVTTALYTGGANKRYFIANGMQPHQLKFAPHAVDNRRFSASDVAEKEAASWRKQLGIAEEEVVALFAGKLEEKKNVVALVDAFIKAAVSGSHLIITGNGPLEKLLSDKAAGKKNIHFLPFQNQQRMPVVYRLCNVFILPSKGPGETWGLAVNEAMACGRAVIASTKCGCAEDLVGDENGFLVDGVEESALVAVMKKAFAHKENLQKMGAAGKAKIQLYSFTHIATAIENAVQIQAPVISITAVAAVYHAAPTH